ncbi:hypothetical protein NDU88_006442 [Pleurodeles waltl]|uniref:Uncharacterized protein n=1 Tax=Pleurodeles waltl TaxID=8319 RepID=A0AAV7WY93_PLEWA|nr:hypothetical protein NDU88_006442 [Pleurodeles waltl]
MSQRWRTCKPVALCQPVETREPLMGPGLWQTQLVSQHCGQTPLSCIEDQRFMSSRKPAYPHIEIGKAPEYTAEVQACPESGGAHKGNDIAPE